MSELLFSSINIIQLLVLVTFLMAATYLEKNTINKKLTLALGCSFLTEVLSVIFIVYKINYGLLYSVNIIVHNCLWLLILAHIVKLKKLILYIVLLYIGFAIANLVILEGVGHFNNYTFVLGAFIYLTTFIIISFRELKKENFSFFYSNSYLLLFAPVLFFLGLSFYFGFQDSDLGDIIIIGNLNLYQVLIYFVNIIYYTLINIYIYREKKLKHA